MRRTLGYMVTWTTYGTWLQGDERGWVKKGTVYGGNAALRGANKGGEKEKPVRLKNLKRAIMSKYNNLKFLKETKARISHTCGNCKKEIKKGEIYYPESIGRVNAPGIKLRKFCKKCYEKQGEQLLSLE